MRRQLRTYVVVTTRLARQGADRRPRATCNPTLPGLLGPSPMSADRCTRCGRRPGRTCAGTPSPTQNRRSASAYGAPGHHPHHAQAGLYRGRAQGGRCRSKSGADQSVAPVTPRDARARTRSSSRPRRRPLSIRFTVAWLSVRKNTRAVTAWVTIGPSSAAGPEALAAVRGVSDRLVRPRLESLPARGSLQRDLLVVYGLHRRLACPSNHWRHPESYCLRRMYSPI